MPLEFLTFSKSKVSGMSGISLFDFRSVQFQTKIHLFSKGIIEQAAKLTLCESICSFCSRMKRARLYACARREGYNVLPMGQHLDDLAERFVGHGGEVSIFVLPDIFWSKWTLDWVAYMADRASDQTFQVASGDKD